MALPGVKSPPNRLPKKGQESKLKESPGHKMVQEHIIQIGEAPNVGPAPAHRRLYERDYSKGAPKPGDHDYVSDALGNPLKL